LEGLGVGWEFFEWLSISLAFWVRYSLG